MCNESKKEGKNQESIQSSTTPDPGYQWESDNFTIRHHKLEPRAQPFPSRWPQSLGKSCLNFFLANSDFFCLLITFANSLDLDQYWQTLTLIQSYCTYVIVIDHIKYCLNQKNPLFVWGWDRKIFPMGSLFVITRQPYNAKQWSSRQIIRIYHECEGRIEISFPRITDGHHEACRVMTNGDPEGRIFLSYPHTNNEFFFLLTIKYHILCLKKGSQTEKYLNTLRCDMIWWRHFNITMMSLDDNVREFQYNQCM